MTAPWLSVVGIGEDGVAGLGTVARAVVDSATTLVGGARHLAMLPEDARPRHVWRSPIEQSLESVAALRGQRVCVLASGDPFWFGVATSLARRIPVDEMMVLPAPSAFSLACARLGWAVQEVEALSLHGRPTTLVNAFLQPDAHLVLLCTDGRTPALVARALCLQGYGPSRLVALQNLGGPRERVVEGHAVSWPAEPVDDLCTLAVECRPARGTAPLARTPGLPDDAFRHDGQLTKREVRAATLAALMPMPGQMLWDVGAGCGSVAIEWMRSHRRCRAIAVENDADRLAILTENAATLGAAGLEIVAGTAPDVLGGLTRPDAVFIGGGLTTQGVFDTCWRSLRAGGRLVANAVTLEGEGVLVDRHARIGGRLVRLAISRAESLGPHTAWRCLRPVTQLALTKS